MPDGQRRVKVGVGTNSFSLLASQDTLIRPAVVNSLVLDLTRSQAPRRDQRSP